MPQIPSTNIDGSTEGLADRLYQAHRQNIYSRTDRVFAILMGAQWVFGIIAAVVISPRTWTGTTSHLHPHVWAAIFLGGSLSSLPIFLAVVKPGHVVTRYVISVSQMLWSALLIHLTGGRIETHFHVFGSLAFLAFYRDWRVLVPATVVVAAGLPSAARPLLPAIRLWRACSEFLALAGTCRLGHLRGYLLDRLVRARTEGNARDREPCRRSFRIYMPPRTPLKPPTGPRANSSPTCRTKSELR